MLPFINNFSCLKFSFFSLKLTILYQHQREQNIDKTILTNIHIRQLQPNRF